MEDFVDVRLIPLKDCFSNLSFSACKIDAVKFISSFPRFAINLRRESINEISAHAVNHLSVYDTNC